MRETHFSPFNEDVGRSVIYVPGVACDDDTHEACETGILTSFNPHNKIAFVRYGNQPNSKATDYHSLRWLFPETQETR